MGKGLKMPPGDLRKLQMIELEMLLEVDRICRKHQIQYFLSEGSLLGAVRHRGFIPWDDDIDVFMMRKEYERFLNICKTELNRKKFFLQTYETDPEYRWFYGKLRRKGTEFLRAGQEAIRCMSGVSIDIFVMDNQPDHYIPWLLFTLLRRGCIKTLWSVVGATEEETTWKRCLYRLLRHINKRIPLGIMNYMQKITNRRETKEVCCIGFYRKSPWTQIRKKGEPRGYCRKWFSDTVEIEFEGFRFQTCKEYKKYLRWVYGDYMLLPPEEERFSHAPRRYQLNVEPDLTGSWRTE